MDEYGTFPPAYSTDKNGKRLLSWRVHLLPYLEQEKLYKEFHLDEPWDSDHNKKLIARMPAVFRSSADPKLTADFKTTYLAARRRRDDVARRQGRAHRRRDGRHRRTRSSWWTPTTITPSSGPSRKIWATTPRRR